MTRAPDNAARAGSRLARRSRQARARVKAPPTDPRSPSYAPFVSQADYDDALAKLRRVVKCECAIPDNGPHDCVPATETE